MQMVLCVWPSECFASLVQAESEAAGVRTAPPWTVRRNENHSGLCGSSWTPLRLVSITHRWAAAPSHAVCVCSARTVGLVTAGLKASGAREGDTHTHTHRASVIELSRRKETSDMCSSPFESLFTSFISWKKKTWGNKIFCETFLTVCDDSGDPEHFSPSEIWISPRPSAGQSDQIFLCSCNSYVFIRLRTAGQ